MDVISLNQAGFENAVATCGTAITDEHARLMSQYVNEVVICYDSDEAGQKASNKAIGMLSQVGIQTKILKMEGAKDPDEYIQKFGRDKFKYILDNSDGAIVFNLDKAKNSVDMSSELGKVEYLKKASQIIADIPTKLEREVYISKLSTEQKIPRSVIEETVGDLIRRKNSAFSKKTWQQTVANASQRVDIKTGEPAQRSRTVKAQEGVISYLFTNPDAINTVRDNVLPEMFQNELLRRIYASLKAKLESSSDYSLSAFADEFSPDEMGRISKIYNLQKEIPISRETLMEYLDTLKKDALKAGRQDGEIDLAEIARRKRNG